MGAVEGEGPHITGKGEGAGEEGLVGVRPPRGLPEPEHVGALLAGAGEAREPVLVASVGDDPEGGLGVRAVPQVPVGGLVRGAREGAGPELQDGLAALTGVLEVPGHVEVAVGRVQGQRPVLGELGAIPHEHVGVPREPSIVPLTKARARVAVEAHRAPVVEVGVELPLGVGHAPAALVPAHEGGGLAGNGGALGEGAGVRHDPDPAFAIVGFAHVEAAAGGVHEGLAEFPARQAVAAAAAQGEADGVRAGAGDVPALAPHAVHADHAAALPHQVEAVGLGVHDHAAPGQGDGLAEEARGDGVVRGRGFRGAEEGLGVGVDVDLGRRALDAVEVDRRTRGAPPLGIHAGHLAHGTKEQQAQGQTTQHEFPLTCSRRAPSIVR